MGKNVGSVTVGSVTRLMLELEPVTGCNTGLMLELEPVTGCNTGQMLELVAIADCDKGLMLELMDGCETGEVIPSLMVSSTSDGGLTLVCMFCGCTWILPVPHLLILNFVLHLHLALCHVFPVLSHIHNLLWKSTEHLSLFPHEISGQAVKY